MEITADSVSHTYDIICFGDEVPGVLALVCAAREHFRQTNRYPRSLLLFKGNYKFGIGGHLVRGGLAYLDRSNIPLTIRQERKLGTFGDPTAIYQEFLKRSGVDQVALDPIQADWVLREMLHEVNADVLSNAEIQSVVKQGQKIIGIKLTRDEVYLATQFIDCTVNAELGQAAGVRKYKGFETLGLPDSEFAVTLVFETQGLTVEKLQSFESQCLQRLISTQDREAQNWLNIAAGDNLGYAEQLRRDLVDNSGLKTMAVGKDYIDIRSKGLSIVYHGFRGTRLSLESSPGILDNGNIAMLSKGRLSWNALLFGVNADEAEALARNKAQPTVKMVEEMLFITKWFQNIGAGNVKPAKELYIRHAGNIKGVIDPLTGSEMLAGGVAANVALGSFGYYFDVRGGIEGFGKRASSKGFGNLEFLTQPLFNIGIQHALLRDVANLAVVSPASGFEGYACAAGRVVEFNCGVGQGVGIAVGIALVHQRELNQISNKEVRDVLEITKKLSQIYGVSNAIAAAQLHDFETSMVA